MRSSRVRERVLQLLASHQAENLSVEEARTLAGRILRRGPEAVRVLFDCLFDESDPNTHRLAVLLLTEMNEPAVLERIHELLHRPQLPEKVRVALLAVEALHEGSADATHVPPGLSDLSLDSLLQFTENFWETMELEEITMMWRENFSAEPPDDRLCLLEALMKSAHPKMLGVVRLEMALNDVKILQFLAEHLGQFRDPMAGRLLHKMLDHPDLVVRTLADQSLARWRKQAELPHPDASGLPALRFYRAHMATDDWSGQYSLIYAVKSPDERIRFVVVLLDRWDRGIIDCWGCVRYSIEEFERLLVTMSRDFSNLRQRRIAKRTALTLLRKAEALNLERKHPLPLEFAIWAHLFEDERFQEDPAIPEFGVDCGICQKPLRTGPRLSPPWVFGKMVVCHHCSGRVLRCPTCGGSTTLAECLLTREDSHGPIDLRCPHCFESLQMSR